MTEMPPIIRQAASRIAGVALGPFIMGERRVDLDALEHRINQVVEREMIALVASVLTAMQKHTDVLDDIDHVVDQLEGAAKTVKAQKSRAGTTKPRKSSKT